MIRCTTKVHCIGIGGVGMAPLAEMLAGIGCAVSGSDRERSALTKRLEGLGIAIQYDHTPALVKKAELVVYSSAVKPENPERSFAACEGIPQIRRAEMVGDLMRSCVSVGVAGTHGKTTTTSLVGHILRETGKNPSMLVGGTLRSSASNAVIGSGEFLVVEADEFDHSFLSMYPTVAVITTVEAEHLDCYHDLEDIKRAFAEYANHVPFYGGVVACFDEPNIQDLLHAVHVPVATYGISAASDYRIDDIAHHGGRTTFALYKNQERLGSVDVPLIGSHNAANATGAIVAAMKLGVPFAAAAAALQSFGGVRRRFEIVGTAKDVTVVDDYAHHPGEIRATLAAARTMGYRRIVAVFQPHLYSRTRDFLSDFAAVLTAADVVVVSGIYRSREEPIDGVSAKAIVDRMAAAGYSSASYVESAGDVVTALRPVLRSGDGVIIMGAGDIGKVGPELLKEINRG